MINTEFDQIYAGGTSYAVTECFGEDCAKAMEECIEKKQDAYEDAIKKIEESINNPSGMTYEEYFNLVPSSKSEETQPEEETETEDSSTAGDEPAQEDQTQDSSVVTPSEDDQTQDSSTSNPTASGGTVTEEEEE